jgi:hypothetical protein
MKRKLSILPIILAIAFSSRVFAQNSDYSSVSSNTEENSGIFIASADNTEAIELFKNELPDRAYILARNGFGENSYIGTPFSVAYQFKGTEENYLFYFPVITDGKIVSYVEQSVSDSGFVSWAVTKWFDGKADLEQFRGKNAYALISNDDSGILAYSDNGAISFRRK